ncbi:unnamed protein product [Scytosiphon promiscuus]
MGVSQGGGIVFPAYGNTGAVGVSVSQASSRCFSLGDAALVAGPGSVGVFHSNGPVPISFGGAGGAGVGAGASGIAHATHGAEGRGVSASVAVSDGVILSGLNGGVFVRGPAGVGAGATGLSHFANGGFSAWQGKAAGGGGGAASVGGGNAVTASHVSVAQGATVLSTSGAGGDGAARLSGIDLPPGPSPGIAVACAPGEGGEQSGGGLVPQGTTGISV